MELVILVQKVFKDHKVDKEDLDNRVELVILVLSAQKV